MAQSGSVAPPVEAMRMGIGKGMLAAAIVLSVVVSLGAGIVIGKYVLSTTASKPTLTVGTNLPFPPFESYNANTSTFYGFDIDFASMIANATHRTLHVVNYNDFSVLLTTVGAGGIDMAASGITESGPVGAARNATMSFSIPYYSANQAVLVKSGSPITCAIPASCTANDLKSYKVGVQTGTTSDGWATSYLVPNETASGMVLRYTTVDTEVAAVTAGAIDVVIIDTGPAASIAAGSSGALKVAGTIVTDELYGFAVAHGDPQDLIPVINGVISTSITDGEYGKLIHKWFG
ncbi:MAG: ABC transporter substrate-binding protein [Thermoplasmata archaeon]|nr:ABC transporter substrate-binding protein [Thermoplasmata archaeon]